MSAIQLPGANTCQGRQTAIYQGQRYGLRLIPDYGATKPSPRFYDCEIILAVPPELEEDEAVIWIEDILDQWYRWQTLKSARARTAFFTQKLNLPNPKVMVRRQKSRWGSCAQDGVLRFNHRLICLPPELIDYVAAHEVCHLLAFNHSAEFWRLLAGIMPDCRSRAKRLKEEGPAYLAC